MTVGILNEYVKYEWYRHMSFEMIGEYDEDYQYSGNMKVRSHAKALADRREHMGLCDLVYNADPGLYENCI